jgi:hypothetical protein
MSTDSTGSNWKYLGVLSVEEMEMVKAYPGFWGWIQVHRSFCDLTNST